MANFVCDICGGKLIMKGGGVAVCETCGMEYSNERLREMAGAPATNVSSAPVSAPAPAQESEADKKIKNYLVLAETELKKTPCNWPKAVEFCDKALEIDVDNFDAWYLKAAATIEDYYAQHRIQQAADVYYRPNLTEAQKKKALDLIKKALEKDFKNCSDEFMYLQVPEMTCIVDVEDGGLYLKYIGKAFEGFSNQLKLIDKRIDEYSMKEYIWKTEYFASSDGRYVLNQLGKVVDGLDAIPEKMYTHLYYTMLYRYEEALRVYKAMSRLSYEEGDYLTDEKKRNPNCAALEDKLRRRVEQFKEIKRQEEAKAREREIQEKKQRYEAYWAEHAEDRKRLETEKADALEKMNPLKEKVAEIEANAEWKEIKEQLQQLKKELAALSIFKMKEKKALKEQIAQAEKQELEIVHKIDEEKRPFTDQISALEKTVAKVDNELKKER